MAYGAKAGSDVYESAGFSKSIRVSIYVESLFKYDQEMQDLFLHNIAEMGDLKLLREFEKQGSIQPKAETVEDLAPSPGVFKYLVALGFSPSWFRKQEPGKPKGFYRALYIKDFLEKI